MEYALYVYMFTLFRGTNLRALAAGVLAAAFLLRLIVHRGRGLEALWHPLLLPFGIFLAATMASVLYSSDPWRALTEYASEWGMVALAALILPVAVRDEKILRRVLYVCAFTAVYLNFIQLKGVWHEYRDTGFLLHDVGLHRPFSLSIIFYLPFLLALTRIQNGRWAVVAWSLAALQILMLVLTASRAATLGLAVGLLLWIIFSFDRKTLLFLFVTVLLTGVLIVSLPKDTFLESYIERGASTSGRASLTWGPTTHMIAQRPFTGYGYGAFVYPQEFQKQIPPSHIPEGHEWDWVKQLGPHNYYLEIWFTSGIAALLALILLCARCFGHLWAFVRAAQGRIERSFALAVLMAFTAIYLIYAQFGPMGPTGLRPLGVLLGFGLALLSFPRAQTEPPRPPTSA